MNGIFSFILVLFLSDLHAQTLTLVKEISNAFEETGHSHQDEYSGLLRLYKSTISDQILNDCIYDQSCSVFSQSAFKNFGLVKGLMLTCDRLTRCNRATHAEQSKVRINKQGKVIDHWQDYAKEK